MPPTLRATVLAMVSLPLLAAAGHAAPAPAAPPAAVPGLGNDIPASFKPATESYDFERRSVMIPMRDGVHLNTVILVPKGAAHFPMLIERTPYSADKATEQADSPHMQANLPRLNDILSVSGYIRIFQDVRGKYGSEGEYVMNRPFRGPLNPSTVDHATDTYDTIDWLVKHVPEANGRVGIIGTSYDGFTALAALIDPHPALKVAVPIAPMVDTWMGDDWFHQGAFRQAMLGYIYLQEATKNSSKDWWSPRYDDYDDFLANVSAGGMAARSGLQQLGFWRRLSEHPAYDAFWQGQALDRILAARGLTVPTLLVDGLWDQEDIYGAPAVWRAVAPKDTAHLLHMVMGPWRHGGGNGDGSMLGTLHFNGDTGAQFRANILQPFLDQYLKDGAPAANIAPITAYETGADQWRRYDAWPQSCAAGCRWNAQALYLQPDAGLGFNKPGDAKHLYDEYVSDPAHPVPYRIRPDRSIYAKGSSWGQWLVDDQREFSTRTDVLTYTSAVLAAPVRIAGAPAAHIFAATTGTDADWVVKLIDVYPDEMPFQPELGGYQLMVSADILRGRYRTHYDKPAPIEPGKVLPYVINLPQANHTFLPGHRIMVQIQSSWFPLYDRNPQTYVPNIFFAKAADFTKATNRVYHAPDTASYVELPVIPAAGLGKDHDGPGGI